MCERPDLPPVACRRLGTLPRSYGLVLQATSFGLRVTYLPMETVWTMLKLCFEKVSEHSSW